MIEIPYALRKRLENAQTARAFQWAFIQSFAKLDFSNLTFEKLERLKRIAKERQALKSLLYNVFELSQKIEIESALWRRTRDDTHLRKMLYYSQRRKRNLDTIRKIYLDEKKRFEDAFRRLRA